MTVKRLLFKRLNDIIFRAKDFPLIDIRNYTFKLSIIPDDGYHPRTRFWPIFCIVHGILLQNVIYILYVHI